jgi:hypothetical protein
MRLAPSNTLEGVSLCSVWRWDYGPSNIYLRRVTRRNKDGSEVSYVQLAHNVWDPVRQRSVTHAIEPGNHPPSPKTSDPAV